MLCLEVAARGGLSLVWVSVEYFAWFVPFRWEIGFCEESWKTMCGSLEVESISGMVRVVDVKWLSADSWTSLRGNALLRPINPWLYTAVSSLDELLVKVGCNGRR